MSPYLKSALTLVALSLLTSSSVWAKSKYLDEQLWKGRMLLVQKKNGEAIELYTKLLKKFPNSSDAYCGLGWVEFQSGKVVEGIEHLEKAIKLNPKNANAHHFLGTILMMIGKQGEGVDHLGYAMILDPSKHCNCGVSAGIMKAYWARQALRNKTDKSDKKKASNKS